jgi:histidinol dehydrogenase
MIVYNNPSKSEWSSIAARPQMNKKQLEQEVVNIITRVRESGDLALHIYSKTFDGIELSSIICSKQELAEQANKLLPELKSAIDLAYQNIFRFHSAQQEIPQVVETSPGVHCWRESRAIERVGFYIPGGSAPLFSTVLMLGTPAQIAGCSKRILCTPPQKDGRIHPAIAYTAQLIGATQVFKCGGAQAIAAMAYGTDTIPKVDKILGPGNQYVTQAKQLIQRDGVSIDMPAGPSELLVIADNSCVPAFVAADLLSQAEHGPDSQVILLSNNDEIIKKVMVEIKKQAAALPRQESITQSLSNSRAIVLKDLYACIEWSNYYAPEHLIIAVEKPDIYLSQIVNAGSVFIGNFSCESAGDYASGTNHTLPTNGYARSYSGVSLDSFIKKITFQELNAEGIQKIGRAIELMATSEGLEAHKNAVSLRLAALKNK